MMLNNILTPNACNDLESMVRTTIFEIIMKTENRTTPIHFGKTRKDRGYTTKDTLNLAQLKSIVACGQYKEYEVEMADVRTHIPQPQFKFVTKKTVQTKANTVRNVNIGFNRTDLERVFMNDKKCARDLSLAIQALETIADHKASLSMGFKAQFANIQPADVAQAENEMLNMAFKTATIDLASKNMSPLDIKHFGLEKGSLVRHCIVDESIQTVDEQCHLGGYYHSVKVFDSGALPNEYGSKNQVFLNVAPQNLEFLYSQVNVYYCQGGKNQIGCGKNRSPGWLAKHGNKCLCGKSRAELVPQTATLRLPEIVVGKESNGEYKTGLRYNTYEGVHFTSARFNKSSGLYQMLENIKNKRVEPHLGIEKILNTSFDVRKNVTGRTQFESASVVPVLFETNHGEFLGLALKRDSLTLA